MAVLTDASGTFIASNLPDGRWQFSCDKPGYLNASAGMLGNNKSTPVLRLVRQAVLTGTVLDERGIGVPFASVQLFQRGVVNGRRQINSVSGAQANDRGEFRVFGLRAGRYYIGANAQFQRRSGSTPLAYQPVLYPGASDIAGAQPIELTPGSEEHLTIRLSTVPAHRVRGKVLPAGRYPMINLQPQDREQLPIAPGRGAFWDEKSNTFTISGVRPGSYLLEVTTELDGRRARVVKPITVGDEDIEGILLAPGILPEITGTVTIDGKELSGAARSHISFQSPGKSAGAEIQNDGSFRIREVAPDSYQVSIPRNDSTYVRSILQGGREVQGGKIVVTESENEPLAIDLSSHGAVIEGVIAAPDAGNAMALIVGLFRTDGDELILHKQTHVNSAVNRPPNSLATFTIQGIAPGEYLLLAWPSDAAISYAEPESMRQYRPRGKTIRVDEGARMSVLIDSLLPENRH